MMPGMPERRTHDYASHGTVISELHRRGEFPDGVRSD
jgi:hypothetical protein